MVIEIKGEISWFKLQLKYDWLIELSDNNLASEFYLITIKEIVIFMINTKISWTSQFSQHPQFTVCLTLSPVLNVTHRYSDGKHSANP